jgi:hypothetical protein
MSPDPAPGWRRRGVLGLLQALVAIPWLAPAATARPMPRPPADPERVFEAGVFEPGVFD